MSQAILSCGLVQWWRLIRQSVPSLFTDDIGVITNTALFKLNGVKHLPLTHTLCARTWIFAGKFTLYCATPLPDSIKDPISYCCASRLGLASNTLASLSFDTICLMLTFTASRIAVLDLKPHAFRTSNLSLSTLRAYPSSWLGGKPRSPSHSQCMTSHHLT